MKKENLLLVFTKNPVLGQCKTRLAKSVGELAALRVYKYLLEHTAKLTKNVTADKWVFYSNKIIEEDSFSEKLFNKKQQCGKDLGEKMQNAFAEGFAENYRKIIIVGSDMLAISTKEIDLAFEKLEKQDYVIGPAEDGGYYLLGMRQLTTNLFRQKKWSTSSVFAETMRNLPTEKTAILETKNDIDTLQDIDKNSVLQKFIEA